MIKLRNFLVVLSLLLAIGLNSRAEQSAYGELHIQYTPEHYDSMFSCFYDSCVVNSYDNFFSTFIDIDHDLITDVDKIPDSIYEARLKMIGSVIPLPFNNVIRGYIIAYTNNLRVNMGNILGLAQYYFPFIEEELDRQGLPTELKILPIIESALYPKAVSRAGATGMWQFMLATGKGMGLEINSFVDERMDPVASTRAACNYLKYLYDIYGDWTLALAAYNSGPGTVNKALKRVPGARTYWDIYNYLPRETRGYVPSFVAATYAYTFHKAHNITPKVPLIPLSVDTLSVDRLMHFGQLSSTINIPVDMLRELNPQYKKDIIPASAATGKSYSLTLPRSYIAAYIENEREIFSKDSLYLKEYLDPSGNLKNVKLPTLRTYKVKKGDYLGKIARQFGVRAEDIRKENKLKDVHAIREGQVLLIP